MRITVTLEASGSDLREIIFRGNPIAFDSYFNGPLRTGLDAANAQLKAENKKLRLKFIDCEVDS